MSDWTAKMASRVGSSLRASRDGELVKTHSHAGSLLLEMIQDQLLDSIDIYFFILTLTQLLLLKVILKDVKHLPIIPKFCNDVIIIIFHFVLLQMYGQTQSSHDDPD